MKENGNVTSVTKKQQFLEVYKRKGCNITAACGAVSISRQTYYRWRKEEEFDQKCKEVEESLIDMAEVQLIKNIREGSQRALEFFLKNRAPNKWKDKLEQKFSGDLDIKIISAVPRPKNEN